MISKLNLRSLYRGMSRIRLVEEEIAKRYDEDKMKCPTHLSNGQEAVAVGVCHALTKYDVVFSTHRCHAHYLAKGGSMKRMIAEMYGKETGCAHGRGGSMHLIDTSVGMYGASAILCGSMPFPVGVAQAFQMRNQDHVSVAFFGDAAVEPGVFHECVNYAVLKKLPVIFVCENNDYSTMTKRRDRQAVPIVERAAGYGLPGVRVDGNDLLAVVDVMDGAIFRARGGEGPTLIEATTYRTREHVEHNKGIMARPEEELRYWLARCPLKRFRDELLSYGISQDDLDVIDLEATREVLEAFEFAEESPLPQISDMLRYVGDEIVEDIEEPAHPGDRTIMCTEAISEATEQAMESDPDVYVMGLHVEDPNGIFQTTTSARKKFGHDRVFETPISEASLTSIAAGAAMMGMRPLHVHARNDFLLLCMSQLGNEISKWHYMSGGSLRMPMVIRAIVGRSKGQGGQHSQSLQSLFAYFPGMHVVCASNAYDAKGLLLTALTGNTPVIFLEHRLCHPLEEAVPTGRYRIPFGKARIRRPGNDVTIVSFLYGVHEAEKAAEQLAEHGISAEVIDLRSIRPWDKETVCNSVQRTRRLIVMDTGWVDFGVSAEISATVTEAMFRVLRTPPIRIGLPPCPTPMSKILEDAYYPGPAQIVAAAWRMIRTDDVPEEYLNGTPATIGHAPF